MRPNADFCGYLFENKRESEIYIMNNQELYDEYIDIISRLNGDEAGRRRAWDRMAHGFAVWGGKPAAMSYIPHCLNRDTREFVAAVTEKMCLILKKVICKYRECPEYRDEFRFDERVKKLVMIPDLFESILPVARIDFVMDDNTHELHFCEFNTDSSSGMAENVEAMASIKEGEAFGIFEKRHKLENDEYFVLGDNRNNSEDSRNGNIGAVKKDTVLGRVWFKLGTKSSLMGFIE